MKLIMICLVIRKREPTVVGWNSIIDSVACKQPEYTPCPLIQSVKNRAIACRTPTLSFSHLRSRLWLVQKRTWFVTVYLIGLLRILFRSVIGGIMQAVHRTNAKTAWGLQNIYFTDSSSNSVNINEFLAIIKCIFIFVQNFRLPILSPNTFTLICVHYIVVFSVSHLVFQLLG